MAAPKSEKERSLVIDPNYLRVGSRPNSPSAQVKIDQAKGKTLANRNMLPSGYAWDWKAEILGGILTPVPLPFTCKGE